MYRGTHAYQEFLDESPEEIALRKHGRAQQIQELEDWLDERAESERKLWDERAALDHLVDQDVQTWKDRRAGMIEPSPF